MVKDSQSPTPTKKPKPLSFPAAIEAVIGGKKIARLEWPKAEYGLLKDSFLTIFRDEKFHTWIVSEGDLLALDWVIIK